MARLDSPKNALHKGRSFSLEETLEFAQWLAGLRDRKAKAMIADRIKRAANGNFGTIRSVQNGVFEMKIDHAPAIGSTTSSGARSLSFSCVEATSALRMPTLLMQGR